MGGSGLVYAYAWTKDGKAWRFQDRHVAWPGPYTPAQARDSKTWIVSRRLPALDNTRWRSLVDIMEVTFVGVRDDGTLWLFQPSLDWSALMRNLFRSGRRIDKNIPPPDQRLAQIGFSADWAEVTWVAHVLMSVSRQTEASNGNFFHAW
jgi:hypothetical protein